MVNAGSYGVHRLVVNAGSCGVHCLVVNGGSYVEVEVGTVGLQGTLISGASQQVQLTDATLVAVIFNSISIDFNIISIYYNTTHAPKLIEAGLCKKELRAK